MECLACVLSAEECEDCGRSLCSECSRVEEVEDHNYYGEVISTYDIICCQSCSNERAGFR